MGSVGVAQLIKRMQVLGAMWVLSMSLVGCDFGKGVEDTAERILRAVHPMAPSIHVQSTEALWRGQTKEGNNAYVVKIVFFAQNGFGATMKNCAYIAFSESSSGEVLYHRENGVNSGNCESFANPLMTEAGYVKMIAAFNDFEIERNRAQEAQVPPPATMPYEATESSQSARGGHAVGMGTECKELQGGSSRQICKDVDLSALADIVRRQGQNADSTDAAALDSWLVELELRCAHEKECIQKELLERIGNRSYRREDNSRESAEEHEKFTPANRGEAEFGRVKDSDADPATHALRTGTSMALEVESDSAERAPLDPKKVTASFDCRLARDVNEVAICSDRELAQVDFKLGRLFLQAVARDPAVKHEQRVWIRTRNRECGGDAVCLKFRIEERIAELSLKQSTDSESGSHESGLGAAQSDIDKTGSEGVPFIRNRPPRYPPKMLRHGIEGEVLLRVLIGADGRAETVEIERSSGYSEFDESATAAAKNWRFRAARGEEDATAEWQVIPVKFSLSD